MGNPKAFLSYSSKDKALAERLARDLTLSGVDVWYAEWKIAPGDSLRRKIDSGIEAASHFLVLLTPNSLQSEWVQTELDAGMIRRISGHCKLIPILHEIQHKDVPPTLAGILWVRLEEADYENGVQKLLDACHGVSSKPAVGPAPLWAQQEPLAEIGLSVHAQRLAALLNERSEMGLEGVREPPLDISLAQETLGMNSDEVSVAAAELHQCGLITLREDANSKPVLLGISPTARLFFETDPVLKGWNPETDARAVASAAVNASDDSVTLRDLDERLSWGARRLNPAVYYLVMHEGVEQAVKGSDSWPYAYSFLVIGASTRLFALGT
jgi:hypothetical protein